MSTIALRQPESRAVKKQNSPSYNRLFAAVVVFLCFVLLLELVYHFVLTPYLQIQHVHVRTDADFPISDDELIRAAGLEDGGTFLMVKPIEIEQTLAAYPCVKTVTVRKVFPDTVRMVLRKRKPLLMSLVAQDDRMVPVAIDEEGVVFETGTTVLEYDLPVVSGVTFPRIKTGMRFPEPLLPFLTDIEVLRQRSPALYSLISEIKFVKKDETDYEVLLYPSRNPIRIRIRPELTEQQLKYYLMVLDVAVQHGISSAFTELDFRTGEAVYRVRED